MINVRKAVKGSRWLAWATVLVMTATLVLAGCSSNSNSEQASNSNQPSTEKATSSDAAGDSKAVEEVKHDPVTISWVSREEPNDSFITSTIAAFQKMYPWITVNYVKAANNDPLAQTIAMQAAGTPADVVSVTDLLGGYKDQLYADLTPYFSNELKDFHIKPDLVDFYKVDGKFYAVPYGNAPIYLYVNKDLLTKYGMQMPANDWTYDQLREMMIKATNEADGTWGMAGTNLFFGAAYSVANGSSPNLWFLNEDKTQSLAGTPEVLNDLQWIKDLVEKDKVIPTNKAKADKGVGDAFGEGKALFNIDGIWMVRAYKDLKFNWDILPLPYGKVSNATDHYPAPMVMTSASKNKEAAVTFLSFFGTVEMGKINVDSGGIPWIVSDELDQYLQNNPIYEGKNVKGIIAGAESCCVLPGINTPGYVEYDGETQGAYWAAMDGGQDLAKVFTPVADKFNKKNPEVRAQLGLK